MQILITRHFGTKPNVSDGSIPFALIWLNAVFAKSRPIGHRVESSLAIIQNQLPRWRFCGAVAVSRELSKLFQAVLDALSFFSLQNSSASAMVSTSSDHALAITVMS
jgi:hypothetical protein